MCHSPNDEEMNPISQRAIARRVFPTLFRPSARIVPIDKSQGDGLGSINQLIEPKKLAKGNSPMTTDATPTPTSHERILAAATGLFALHGFDGVSTRQIAAETGLNISTIHHHVGSKRELYLKVIEGLYEKEELLIGEMLLGVDDAAIQDPERFNKALFSLIGRLLDFARENQARQRLYVRRWLDPADELREREAELTLRLYRRLAKTLKRGQELGVVRKDIDIGYFLRSCDWMVFCFFTSGAFSWRSLRVDPTETKNLDRFKAYLCDHTQKMLET